MSTSHIRPSDPRLLTETDINPPPFHCCGDEDLLFIKCPTCGHLMVFCYECETLHPDLTDVEKQSCERVLVADEDRVVCPRCREPFEEYTFLMPAHVDKYLVTAEEVVARGFRHLLSDDLQQRFSR